MKNNLVDLFEAFMADATANEMYVQGVAGTGKTTSLAKLITYCQDMRYTSVTCAYTHKAVKVLASKLPPITTTHMICTLHSYLKKRPTINDKATKIKHVDTNTQMDIPSIVNVIFIDEFSMIGEKDYSDLLDLQYDEEGNLITKIVYIGDPNQLPPVKDQQSIIPNGNYVHTLTKIYRQKDGSALIDTLLDLNDYINGKPAEFLKEHKQFRRNMNIVSEYKRCKTSKILLAYTNYQVQCLNIEIQGRIEPLASDEVFSPTIRKLFTFNNFEQLPPAITTIRGELLELESKYKTLETLHEIPQIQFFNVTNLDGTELIYAGVFGHDNYLQVSKELANDAVKLNRKIENQYNEDAKSWANRNWSNPLARERALAWKRYLSFKDNVICLDFNHAMTVHKSQGSTYENVFLDIEDIGKCANTDYLLYLKLLYVAISRASDTVYTN